MKFYGSIAARTGTNWLRFELDADHSPDPGTGFTPEFWILAGYVTSYGQISMKFYGSITAGIWTNWLGFEPDPDKRSDPGTGFTPDFWISAGYLKKLWTDLVKFNKSIAAGLPHHSPDPGTGFFNFSGLSQQVMDGFRRNFMVRQLQGSARFGNVLSRIRMYLKLQGG